MPFNDLGEFDLIARIVERLGEAAARDILVPPGDDAAAWTAAAGVIVATTDSLTEGTHWRPDTMSLADVGWRSATTCVSDLAAMGAEAGQLLIASELGPDLSLDDLDAFVDGLAAACRCLNVRVVGGNVVRGRTTSFTATAIGRAATGPDGVPALLRRNGARAGDTVAASGTPGASAAGLALIEAGRGDEPAAAPLVAAHRRPHARLALGRAALEAGVRCAIDVSDGLVQDLGHVAKASGAGIEVELETLPLHPAAVELLGRERAPRLVLGGGDDYELALTGPAATLDALSSADLPLRRIGRVVADHPGEVVVRDAAGRLLQAAAEGWDQLR